MARGSAVDRPLPVSNVENRAFPTNRRKFVSGEDMDVWWTYAVRDGHGAAANEVLAGQPMSTDPRPSDGDFVVRIYDFKNELRRTIEVPFVPSGEGPWTHAAYTFADRDADFGGSEPNVLKVGVCCRSGLWESVERRVTFTKV
jgi:hypothetical protein